MTHVDFIENTLAEHIVKCTTGCRMYSEEFMYGADRVIIDGVPFIEGDPTGIPGNLQAWNIYVAILIAREAHRNGRKPTGITTGRGVRNRTGQ